MNLAFDIFQGVGVATAVGVRPFLPAVVAGSLAAGDVELSLRHTDLHFLQRPAFLGAMFAAGVLVALVQSRSRSQPEVLTRGLAVVLAVLALAVGALFCGGAIARAHHPDWIGIVAGALCAAVAVAATLPLLARVRARLDTETAALLPILAELGAGLGAGLSVLAPPVGVILLAAMAWLLVAGRGRSEQKYAGLRILR